MDLCENLIETDHLWKYFHGFNKLLKPTLVLHFKNHSLKLVTFFPATHHDSLVKSTYVVEIGNIYLAPHLIRVNKGKKVSET